MNKPNEKLDSKTNTNETQEKSYEKPQEKPEGQVDEKSSEETSDELTGTPEEQLAKIKEQNKQLFERAKKAELKVKELDALASVKKEADTSDLPELVKLAKLANALKDYSEEEVDIITRQAKALGTSITEAMAHEDVKLLIEAKREKIKKEEANPKPTSTQGTYSKGFAEWTADDIRALTSNPTKENIKKLTEYNSWTRSRS